VRVSGGARRAPRARAPVVFGELLGVASWVAELPNSFFKRRIGN
jgi:hypothetical protein